MNSQLQLKTITIASHDAGGAEVVSAWVRANPQNKYFFILEGPAIKIFNKKIKETGDYSPQNTLKYIKLSDLIITATSWASDLEKNVIALAIKEEKKTISFLDHWCNYKERFEQKGKIILPDEVWVGDHYAKDIAKKAFSERVSIRIIPNPYFEEIKESIKTLKPKVNTSKGVNILFVSEPIKDHAIKCYNNQTVWGYTEFDAIDLFFKTLTEIEAKKKLGPIHVKFRLHPSEQLDKYDELLHKFSTPTIEVSNTNELIEDCLWADWVVGCESMALVVGVLAEKKVFSTIPPGGKPSSLPFQEISNFTCLINNHKLI